MSGKLGFVGGDGRCPVCLFIRPAVLEDALGRMFCSLEHAEIAGVRPFDPAEGVALMDKGGCDICRTFGDACCKLHRQTAVRP